MSAEPLTCTLRPKVSMGQYACVPHVVALAVAETMQGMAIGWPHDLVDAENGKLVSHVRASAGYDGGMYCTVTLDLTDEDGALERAIRERVDEWADALTMRTAPLAPVLAAYAEQLFGLGERSTLTYPNGREVAEVTFAGVDVWGRATVRLVTGEEREFTPEQYRLRLVRG